MATQALALGGVDQPRSVVGRGTSVGTGARNWLWSRLATSCRNMAKRGPTTQMEARPRRPRPIDQVFVSHASADKWIAKTFCEKIEQTGATTFRDDRDIAGGDNIPDSIRTQIQLSREMVVLLTPDSIDRGWVKFEVGAAWGRRKTYLIVPVLCHVTVDAIPEVIKPKRAFHINDFDRFLDELTQRVQA